MKKKKLTVICSVCAVIVVIAILLGIFLPRKKQDQTQPMKNYVQNINYTESTDKINNPDQGFYRPIYVRLTETGISYNKNIVNNSTQLYHLRIDISAFSKAVNGNADKLLTTDALDGLDEILTYLEQKDNNAIVRFAYDPSYGGTKDMEPDSQIIVRHLEQVCPILNKYQTTITAIEAGLIGPWGEMHSSVIANATYINPIIKTFLTNTTGLPILVRTPAMIYNYLGITINDIDNYNISPSHKAYRLGLYNDGYLGSDSDLGTYRNREKEIEFLSKQTGHLPYGGEVVIPNSNLHDIENCLPEMFKMNLNYLNIEWNYEVIDKWKNTKYTSSCGNDEKYFDKSAFTYIENHMGYRFVLTNSVFEYSNKFDKLNIKLTLKNVGFGNLNKTKLAKLLFVDDNDEIKFAKQVTNFAGETEINYSINLNLENGNYKVYLCLFREENENATKYNLQFANEDIWDNTICANKIGEINIQK